MEKIGKTPKDLGMEVSTISLDLTERCNLRCTYCFADIDKGGGKHEKTKESSADLPIEVGKAALDWFLSEEVSGKSSQGRTSTGLPYRVDLWGGEPLLKFDLITELVAYGDRIASEQGKELQWGGTTNVTLLDREKLTWLLPRNIHFLLSVDGIGERNKLRSFADGTNSWSTIDKQLDIILEEYHKFKLDPPHIRMTPSPENLKGLADDVIFLHQKGFKTIFFSENYDTNWEESDYQQYRVELDKLVAYRIEQLKQDTPLKSKFMDDCSKYILDSSLQGHMIMSNSGGRACGAGNSFIGISIEGALYPCHRFNKHNTVDIPWQEKETCIGSIYDGITNEAFLNKMNEAIIPYAMGDKSPLTKCKDCKLQGLCLGGCYAAKYDYDGTFTNTIDDRICNIRRIFYDASLKEITTSLTDGVLGKLAREIGVKILFNNQFADESLPNCACNLSGYISTADILEHLISDGKYNDTDDQTARDSMFILSTMRRIIDQELSNLARNNYTQGCLCNTGMFNRDYMLSENEIDEEIARRVIDAFTVYWELKYEQLSS